MAYRIVYGPEQPHPQIHRKQASHFLLYTGAFFVCFLLTVHLLWPEGAQTLRTFLNPVDDATVACFQQMVTSMENGVSFSDAAYAFCKDILSNAGIS